MSASLVLYVGEKNISSWSMRPFVALAHKGLPFEERAVSLFPEDEQTLRRVSPTGRVPVLHHGERVIPDSLAILEYLEESFPAPLHPALWPSDPGERAHARWLAAAMHSGFAELRESMSFNLCFLPQPPAASPGALAEAREMLALWEDALARKTEPGPYLFGPFGGADVMYAPAVVRLTAFRVPLDDFPRTSAYLPAVLEHPAVRRWMDAARKLLPVERE